LNYFGGDTPGSLDDGSDKFTGEDRLSIDRILTALEKHNHRLNTAMDVPGAPPALTFPAGIEGTLEGGTTYYYCVSFVNDDGLETVAGPEVSLPTPDLLPAPDAPSGETSDSTGTLSAGLYYYALSALRDEEESPLGALEAVTVLSGENTVTLTLPAPGDATGFQVWRQKDTDPGWTRIATATSTTFLDTGTIAPGVYGDPANIPPATNTGISSYAIQIALTGADLSGVGAARSWRIYRSEISGIYTSTALIHEVIERDDDLDPTSALKRSWIDDGDAPLTGSPKEFSTELQVPPFTFDTADPLPDATNYPDNYPMVDGSGVLYLTRSGIWVAVTGQPGVAFFTGTGDPTGVEPTGYHPGDLYIDLATGDLYEL
jgi:hypothetical protein